MEFLKAILAVVAALMKLPADWTDKAAVEAWLTSVVEPLAVVLALLLGGKKVASSGELAAMQAEGGEEAVIAQALYELENYGKINPATIKAIIQMVLMFIQMFVKPTPAPTPTPTPTVV